MFFPVSRSKYPPRFHRPLRTFPRRGGRPCGIGKPDEGPSKAPQRQRTPAPRNHWFHTARGSHLCFGLCIRGILLSGNRILIADRLLRSGGRGSGASPPVRRRPPRRCFLGLSGLLRLLQGDGSLDLLADDVDIQEATSIARNMVAMFGMSDEFGMMALPPAAASSWTGGTAWTVPRTPPPGWTRR